MTTSTRSTDNLDSNATIDSGDRLAAKGGSPVASEFISPVHVAIEEDEIEDVVRVLRSGQVRQGKACESFENEFAEATGAKFAFTTSNGTTALQLAYEALIEPGDEVLCPGFTFIATASMIIARGAVPVFCEIDPATFTIDPDDAAKRITPKTRAIAPVHLYGNPAHIHDIESLAQKHGLKVIYDAAQSHLARYDNKPIGAFGHACTYSFYPTKNMTTGEGGMITTNDPDLARRIALMRDHGMEPGRRYHHVAIGYNYRLNDVAAALGRKQLRKLCERTARRQHNAARLTEQLSDVSQISCPTATPDGEHVFHQYTIRVHVDQLNCTRDGFANYLKAENVGSAVHYPSALTEQPIIRERINDLPALSECERAGREVLCLPIHHALTDDQIDQIARAIRKVAHAMSA